MKEQTAQDRLDESEGAKKWWADLKASAAAGDAAAVAKLEEISKDASIGSKEGWAKKHAEEGK